MKKAIIILLAMLLYTCDNDNNNSINNDCQTELQTLIDNKWNDYTSARENYPGGYALQVIAGDEEYYVASGELAASDNQIHFRGGSTTKSFTAAGILLLHQQGLLNINHYITDPMPGKSESYLPDTDDFNIPNKSEITIKLLLQNRAGVFDLINSDVPDTVTAAYAGLRYADYVIEVLGEPTHTFTTEEMTSVVAQHQLCYFKPGEEFHYSDTGFNLLGYIIERVSGESYADFITTNLLTPNELMETTFPSTGTAVTLPAEFASSYAYYMGESYDLTEVNPSMHQAEGNVVTTPHDLTKWMMRLLKGEAGIDRKYIQFLMMDCQPTLESHQYYGLGCVYTPGLGYGHNGGTSCYFTVSRYDPELDLAFTSFTNVWDYNAFETDMYTQLFELYDLSLAAKEVLAED